MAGRLNGKVALVTGAASGIGRGTVDLFVAEGARVVAADIQDDKGARLAEDDKGKAVYVHCDVTKEADIAGAIAAAGSHFGRLDCLYNNAGAGGAREGADGVTAEGFDAVMHLHLRAAMFGIKHAVPIMKAQGGGSIISTASVAGISTGYGPFLYSVAKAALVHMTHFAATELGPFGIRVNCICPGLIATSIFGSSLGVRSRSPIAQWTPLPKVPRPRNSSSAADCLPTSRKPHSISQATGHPSSPAMRLVVDGGLTQGHRSCRK